MDQKVILEIKTPRDSGETPESMVQFLSGLAGLKNPNGWFRKKGVPISFEIAAFDQSIHFFVVVPANYQSFLESQLLSQYPRALISKISKDHMNFFSDDDSSYQTSRFRLEYGTIYPLKTYKDFKDVDPLSFLLGVL